MVKSVELYGGHSLIVAQRHFAQLALRTDGATSAPVQLDSPFFNQAHLG